MTKCRYQGCPEDRWEGDEQHCIFHCQRPDKDPDFFRQRLAAKRDRNYQGYFFPIEADFSGQTLVDADFGEARFAERADFSGATFEGDRAAYFRRARFAAAYLRGARFAAAADFRGAQFAADADFGGAQFKEQASFINTRFQSAVYFNGASMDKALFRGAGWHR